MSNKFGWDLPPGVSNDMIDGPRDPGPCGECRGESVVNCKDCDGYGCPDCEDGQIKCPDCKGTGDDTSAATTRYEREVEKADRAMDEAKDEPRED